MLAGFGGGHAAIAQATAAISPHHTEVNRITAGGGLGSTCQSGVFLPLDTVPLPTDAATGGFVVTAQ